MKAYKQSAFGSQPEQPTATDTTDNAFIEQIGGFGRLAERHSLSVYPDRETVECRSDSLGKQLGLEVRV